MKRRVLGLFFIMLLILNCLVGCGKPNQPIEKVKITIAYQYGIAHCPAIICKENGYIEAAYREATGKDLEIEWVQMNSGADVNTGMAAGQIDAGFCGVPVAINGIMGGAGYKIFINESGVRQCFMTNDSNINSLADLVGSAYQVALVNIGSANHIALGLALVSEGLDPHALDSNIVAMKYPDGLAAISSGTVACHIATEPYLSSELEMEGLHEIKALDSAWSKEDSFNVGIASEDLYNNYRDIYDALVVGVEKSLTYIEEDATGAAEILSKYGNNTKEENQQYLENSTFHSETKNLYNIAVFMSDNGFVSKKPESFSDLVFDNVKGN